MNDCYKCIHRGTVPGDQHSCCRHPDLEDATTDPIGGLVDMLSGLTSTPPGQPTKFLQVAKKLEIRANRHGIEKGWFYWPWNFDPVWLENCNGFKSIN